MSWWWFVVVFLVIGIPYTIKTFGWENLLEYPLWALVMIFLWPIIAMVFLWNHFIMSKIL